MKTPRFPLLFLALAAAVSSVLVERVRADTRVLPFQGRLTDANGNSVPDGARVVQFKIYDAPVGGRAVWNGEVQNLTINAGLVSTLLGTKSSLAGLDFNQDLYLELTVDANADAQISLTDPPLLPRQSILPAVFAKESANSQLLGGYNWSALFGTNNPADGTFLDSKIANNSLTTTKIRDNAVTSAKIASRAVTLPKLDTTGASAGQSLVYNGTQVAWSSVNAVTAQNAVNADNAAHLNGFDWTALFDNGNPTSGGLSVAGMTCRGDMTVSGRALFNGPAVTVLGQLVAPSIGLNMSLNDWGIYFRAVGDFNHYLKWDNAQGNQFGFDGPELVGNLGGILGTPGNWSLRWNSNGSVQTRGSLNFASDRNLKENFTPVDGGDLLAKVAALSITRWNYKDDPAAKHLGPVAQDFHAAFGLGSDDKFISVVDADGVALAALQALNRKVDENESDMRRLITVQQQQIDALKAEIAALRAGQR